MTLTRTVRIINRWWSEPSSGYHGVRVDTVTVPWVCCTCGGPRGEPRLESQCEDGEWLWVSRWENPCGHTDMYRAVADQAEQYDAVNRGIHPAVSRLIAQAGGLQ